MPTNRMWTNVIMLEMIPPAMHTLPCSMMICNCQTPPGKRTGQLFSQKNPLLSEQKAIHKRNLIYDFTERSTVFNFQ